MQQLSQIDLTQAKWASSFPQFGKLNLSYVCWQDNGKFGRRLSISAAAGVGAAVNLHSYVHIVDTLYVAFGIYEWKLSLTFIPK